MDCSHGIVEGGGNGFKAERERSGEIGQVDVAFRCSSDQVDAVEGVELFNIKTGSARTVNGVASCNGPRFVCDRYFQVWHLYQRLYAWLRYSEQLSISGHLLRDLVSSTTSMCEHIAAYFVELLFATLRW